MTAADRELFRLAILRVLDANRTRFGLSPAAIRIHVQQFGFGPKPEDVQAGLDYLEGKGFVFVPSKAISPENQTWKITDAGEIELEKHG